jgi:hypothetical protein
MSDSSIEYCKSSVYLSVFAEGEAPVMNAVGGGWRDGMTRNKVETRDRPVRQTALV